MRALMRPRTSRRAGRAGRSSERHLAHPMSAAPPGDGDGHATAAGAPRVARALVESIITRCLAEGAPGAPALDIGDVGWLSHLVLRVLDALGAAPPAPSPPSRYVVGVLDVDFVTHRVSVGGQDVILSRLEMQLLQYLIERRGAVHSRHALMKDVWSYASSVTTRTVDAHVARLRAKLGEAGALIESIRGVGYRFTARPPR